MRAVLAVLLLAVFGPSFLCLGCGREESAPLPPVRDCTKVIWVRPQRAGADVWLTGSWNGWQGNSVPVPPYGADGWHMAWIALPPGQYGYQVVEDGVAGLDVQNPLTTFRGDTEVSLLLVDDCRVPLVRVDQVVGTDDGTVRIDATFLTSSSGSPLEPSSVAAVTFDGSALPVVAADPATGQVTVRAVGLSRGKYTVRLEARDQTGVRAQAGSAVAWVQPAMRSWEQGVLYQVMVDRYRADGGAPLAPPATPGSRAGGTLEGVRADIERGVFDRMGVTALWLSPVYVNPTEPRQGRGDGHLYEGYHGYWPLDSYAVDPRLGGEQALWALVREAHAHGLRVLLDIVPNHVYERNPLYVDHRNAGWFHEGAGQCVCGDPGCGWDTHIESCWFTPYLPDYRFENAEVMDMAASDAVWWSEVFDIDGVRIDAVPMMPRATTRRIADAMRSTVAPRQERFVLGEVYTGGGQGGIDSIRYYLGPWGLDSAFDFPLMWTLRDAIATDRAGFDALEKVLHDSEEAFAGSGAVMSRIIGNHDTTRFISEAAGDAGGDPWRAPPPQPVDQGPYLCQKMALAFVLTLPGLPLIYYGDEVGLAGAGDPDCRRVMPSFDALSANQRLVLDAVRRIGQLRRCSPALRSGARVALHASRDAYAYLRDAGDGRPVLVLLAKGTSPLSIPVGDAVPEGGWVDVLTGESISIGPDGTDAKVTVDPWTVRVLVLAADPCR